MLDKEMIFIIGSPRSGTTWLQTMIGAHPLVATTVELTLYNRYTGPWLKAWEREAAHIRQGDWEQGLPFLLRDDEFISFLRLFLEMVYERVLAPHPQATHILDKFPTYSYFVEDINKLLPHARFIHIIRDGRDVALSMVDARKRLGFGTATIPASAAEWKGMLLAARQASQYDGRYMEVTYKGLKHAGVDTLGAVFDFCGLPVSREEVSEIIEAHEFKKMQANGYDNDIVRPKTAHRRGTTGSWQVELTPLQRYLFDQVAGDLLGELGYAEDGWWAQSMGQRVTLPIRANTLLAAKRVRDASALLIGAPLSERLRGTLLGRVMLEKLATF